MDGLIRRSYGLVALVALTACVSGVLAQDAPWPGAMLVTPLPNPNGQESAYVAASTFTPAPESDLVKRVTELEMALRRRDDDAAAARMKAEAEKAIKKCAEDAAKAKAASQPSFTAGGLLQFDTAAFGNKNATTLNDATLKDPAGRDPFINGAEVRRFRLQVSGEAFLNTDYKAEVELANTSGRPGIKDLYFTVKELPWARNVRVGHFKEPFGLEQLTSDRYSTFMERSMGDENFIVPSRNLGVMEFGWTEDERATWAMGVFLNQSGLETPPFFGYNAIPGTGPGGNASAYPVAPSSAPGGAAFTLDDRPQAAATMRATWLPWYDEATAGRGLWHTGIAYSYRADEGYRVGANGVIAPNYTVRPEAHLAPVILNTNALPAIDNQLLGVEQAFVYGPFSAQGEYYGDWIQQPGGASRTFTGGYAYVSYFLTGENRPYNRKLGTFDRVRPFTNFFRVRTCDECVESGWGAWEIGYRISYVDMLDGIPAAQRTVGLGRATDQTIGLNWYLNPYSRIMANYVLTTFDRVDAVTGPTAFQVIKNHTVNTFEMRAQFDF